MEAVVASNRHRQLDLNCLWVYKKIVKKSSPDKMSYLIRSIDGDLGPRQAPVDLEAPQVAQVGQVLQREAHAPPSEAVELVSLPTVPRRPRTLSVRARLHNLLRSPADKRIT